MDASLLRGELKSTGKAFLSEVFGDMDEPEREAGEKIFSTILNQGTPLLSRLAKDEDAQHVYVDETRGKPRKRQTTRKGVQEWMSRWLEKGDFNAGEYLLSNGVRFVQDDTTIAFDQSDISKEFGGKGMEGMAKGHDGSRGVTAMGHDVIGASVVPMGRGVAIPLLVELRKGRTGAPQATRRLIDQIFRATGGRGQLAMDRGYDGDEQIYFLFERGYKAVIRVKHMKRDVFGDGLEISEAFQSQYLRTQTEACKFVMKAMKDSFHKVAAGAQAFVINLREMLRCEKIAFISGRPRKREAIDRRQLLLAL